MITIPLVINVKSSLMFMLEVEETEEERGDQELSLAHFTDVGLEEYSGELCRISLNAIFGGAQYRTVKVRSEKEKKQNEYFGGYYK